MFPSLISLTLLFNSYLEIVNMFGLMFVFVLFSDTCFLILSFIGYLNELSVSNRSTLCFTYEE